MPKPKMTNKKFASGPKVEKSRGNPDMAPYDDPGQTRPNAGIQTAGNKTSKKTPKMKGSVPGQPF